MACRWLEANGIQLRYEHLPAKHGTIVLVHEMGGAIESWDAITPALAERWGILRYDQRGSGLSEKIRQPLTLDIQVDDLVALLDRLEVTGPLAMVSCALGAALAVRFAARYPERLSALILMSPAVSSAPDRRDWMYARAESFIKQGVRAVIGVSEERKRDTHEILRLVSDPSSLAEYWKMLANLDLDASFAAITCPTLMVAGEHDRMRHPAFVASVAKKVPHSKFIALDSGHVIPVETPGLAITTITDFLVEQNF